jgi:two-component system, NtrC family, sensor histidine kinase HydH
MSKSNQSGVPENRCENPIPLNPEVALLSESLPASFAPAAANGTGRNMADFAEVIAHRLRGPLAGLHCYSDLLFDLLVSDEQRELAFRIYECGAVIERMLTELQRYSFQINPIMRSVPVEEFLSELMTVGGHDNVSVGWSLRQSERPSVICVEGDPILLRQLFLVLLQNAMDAAEGIDPGIWINVNVEQEVVRFEISNPGAIPAEALERAFEPFFTTKAQNLGLGLSIAWRITEAHGTVLEPQVSPGVTTMAFTLKRLQ